MTAIARVLRVGAEDGPITRIRTVLRLLLDVITEPPPAQLQPLIASALRSELASGPH